MRENPREYALEPTHSAQAGIARPPRRDTAYASPPLARTEGLADNFSLDINFVTGA